MGPNPVCSSKRESLNTNIHTVTTPCELGTSVIPILRMLKQDDFKASLGLYSVFTVSLNKIGRHCLKNQYRTPFEHKDKDQGDESAVKQH